MRDFVFDLLFVSLRDLVNFWQVDAAQRLQLPKKNIPRAMRADQCRLFTESAACKKRQPADAPEVSTLRSGSGFGC